MFFNRPFDIRTIKGFLPEHEGQALYRWACEAAPNGPLLEVGSYCGLSTCYLGVAAKQANSVVFAVDHHRGSEEHQLGEEYHDPQLFNRQDQLMDSFGEFRRTLIKAELEPWVVPVVAASEVAARCWQTPLAMVFIDGGHSFAAAETDYHAWAPKVMAGGILAIHDLFPDPEKGGQAPITIWRKALASGLFEVLEVVDTLGFLRRKAR